MAKKEAKANKNKKSFAKDFKAELKKVIWPTPKQLLNNTVAVLTIVLITVAIVFVLDLALKSLNKYGVNKAKEIITSVNSTENETIQSNEISADNENEDTSLNTDEQEIETTVDTDNSTESNVE